MVFFAVARVLISVCWLFSVTAKKEPSKEEPKEKVKVRKLVTFRVNRSQNFRVVSAAGMIATLRCTESNGRQIHVTVLLNLNLSHGKYVNMIIMVLRQRKNVSAFLSFLNV